MVADFRAKLNLLNNEKTGPFGQVYLRFMGAESDSVLLRLGEGFAYTRGLTIFVQEGHGDCNDITGGVLLDLKNMVAMVVRNGFDDCLR